MDELKAKAHEIMQEFCSRWGYVSSSAETQEKYLAEVLRHVNNQGAAKGYRHGWTAATNAIEAQIRALQPQPEAGHGGV